MRIRGGVRRKHERVPLLRLQHSSLLCQRPLAHGASGRMRLSRWNIIAIWAPRWLLHFPVRRWKFRRHSDQRLGTHLTRTMDRKRKRIEDIDSIRGRKPLGGGMARMMVIHPIGRGNGNIHTRIGLLEKLIDLLKGERTGIESRRRSPPPCPFGLRLLQLIRLPGHGVI